MRIYRFTTRHHAMRALQRLKKYPTDVVERYIETDTGEKGYLITHGSLNQQPIMDSTPRKETLSK